MKRILLALLMVAVSAAGAWGITELDATVPANSALISTFATYERETRAKVNELINAGTEAALPGIAMVSTYADFATALTTIGSTATTLLVNEDVTISADTTIPSNVQLVCTEGNILTVASGKVLTINGPFLCGLQQIFAGTGTVEFTNVTEVYPEWWGGLGDGTSDDSAEVRAAMISLPAEGGKVRFSCKNWTFNLTVDQPNIWLDGCGATSNTYWATGQWQAYDTTLPLVKVTSVAYSTGVKANTGFQLTNAHLNGINSDGVKFGQKGLLIRSSEYHNIDNVNVEYFVTYQLQLGDSDMVALGESGINSEWVYFGNFSNSTFKAHQTYTTGDTIKQIYDGNGVTSQYFANCNIYGPSASGGYTLYNVTNQRFTNSYMQIPADGHGLYKSSIASGKYMLVNTTVEGPYSGDYYADTACTVTSYHTTGNSVFSVLQMSNVNITGNYCDGNGEKWLLYEMEAAQQTPAFYQPRVVSALQFVYGGLEDYISQIAAARRVYLQRSRGTDYGENVLDIYGTNGTVVHASTTGTNRPALRVHNRLPRFSETRPYGISVVSQDVAGVFRLTIDDNGTTYPIYPALRIYRLAHDRAGDGLYDPTINGFGTGIDFYLGVDSVGAEDAAGRISYNWVSAATAAPTSTMDITIKGLKRNGDSASVGGLNLLNGATTFSSKGKDTHDITLKLDDNASMNVEQARIRAELTDNSTTAENSVISFWTKASGTLAERARITTRGIAVDGYTPANAQAACTTGEIAWDNSTIYVCVDGDATVKWRKTTMASW